MEYLEMDSEVNQLSVSTMSHPQRKQKYLAWGYLCAEYIQRPCFHPINSLSGQLLNSTDVVLGTHLQVSYSIGEDIGRRLQKLCHLM